MSAKSTLFWSAAKLREAIERCNRECEALIASHAPAEAIMGRRRGIEHLHKLLENAERVERGETDES